MSRLAAVSKASCSIFNFSLANASASFAFLRFSISLGVFFSSLRPRALDIFFFLTASSFASAVAIAFSAALILLSNCLYVSLILLSLCFKSASCCFICLSIVEILKYQKDLLHLKL